MLSTQFLGQNLHFAIGLFATLSLFAVAWLYFDAWIVNRRSLKNLLRWLGFFLLSIAFLAYAVDVPWIGSVTKESSTNVYRVISELLRVAGYIAILVAEIIDPLQKIPVHEEELIKKPKKSDKKSNALLSGPLFGSLGLLTILFSGSVAYMYFRRSTKGLERHLKPLFLGFLALTAFEVLAQAYHFRDSSNVILGQLASVYGPVWLLENAVLLGASILLGLWVWKYLTKRFMSQLFMIFTGGIMAVFLVTTLSFTFLLLKNIQNETLNNLKTTANVLNYAIDSKRSETVSSSEALVYNPEYISAIIKKDHAKLAELSSNYLTNKKQSTLVITDDSGQVLLRAEDSDRWGDSISSDPLVRRALIGRSASSIASHSGVVAPTLYITSTSPVRSTNNLIVGTITTGVAVDDSFVDGIKKSTGLEASIYSDNIRSATTTFAADGKSRWVGVKEENPVVKNRVLEKGEVFSGTLSILNRPYIAAYSPLKDVDNEVAGMILIGQPQTNLLQTANKTIQKTFVLAAILLVLSVIPAYFVSKYIVKQL